MAAKYQMYRLACVVTLLVAVTACSTPASVVRTQRLINRGDYERASSTLSRALAERPGDRELLGLRLRLSLAEGKQAEAAALYQKHRSRKLLRSYAIAAIWAAMRHRDPELRLEGVHAARSADAPELMREMAKRLSDPDERVKSWAAVALSTLPAGADALQAQLRSTDPRARAIAVGEVGRIAKGKAYDTVVRFVGAKSAVVRAAAARALGYSARQQAVPLLAKLSADTDKSVRHAAIGALDALGHADGREAVRKRLQDEYLPVRIAALAAYDKLAGKEALLYLREAAKGGNASVALHAGRLLAKRGETQPVLNAIAKALVDRSWTVRAAGVNTASMIKDKVAWQLATRGLRDAEPAVRLATVRMLRAKKLQPAKGDRAAEALFALLCSKTAAELEASAFSRCEQAAELLAQRKAKKGKRKLDELSKGGKRWQDRAAALRGGLRFFPSAKLALIGLADRAVQLNLIAAIYIYRKLR